MHKNSAMEYAPVASMFPKQRCPCVQYQSLNFDGRTRSAITGWWYTYPSEKYESQWEGYGRMTSHI
jgi:hypothetical protein